MRRHLRILTATAMLTLLTFGLAAPAQATDTGGNPAGGLPLLGGVPLLGHLLGGGAD